MTSSDDQIANFEVVRRLATRAIETGCSMIFLPENVNFMGTEPRQSLSVAEPLDGPAIGRYKRLAKDLG